MEPKGIVAASQPQWISVKDRLPADGQDVLAYVSDEYESRIIAANYESGSWFDCVLGCYASNVTHWMPLPKPPKEVQR